MFNIFKKKKKIVLDCFTHLSYAYDYAKIDKAIKFVPDWWKSTPKFVENNSKPTVKNCPGFVDFYKNGIVIPSWFELEVTVFEKGYKNNYEWNSSNTDFKTDESHDHYQFAKFAQDDGHNFKITSPWAFKTKENINFTWTQPTWSIRNLLSNFILLPATVNYKYQHGTNINYFVLNTAERKTFRILPLTPLVIIHAQSEQDIIIKNHLVSEKEYQRIFGVNNLILTRTREEIAGMYSKKIEINNKIERITNGSI